MKRHPNDNRVFPLNDPTKKKIALITGAGAVEGAWDPILKALVPFHDFPLSADGANSFLTSLIYQLRWCALTQEIGEENKQSLVDKLEIFRRVKDSMIAELKKAERKGAIKPRPILEKILLELVIKYSPYMILISTNWDSVVPDSVAKIFEKHSCEWCGPIHLHGDTKKLSTMYLPSEITKEPYRKNKDEQMLGSIHTTALLLLEHAHRVIVYGLSIDPLDAELGQTLAAGWSNHNLDEIFIVNPDHKLVAHRVNLLLDRRRDVRVIGLNPETLVEEADYTIWRPNKPK